MFKKNLSLLFAFIWPLPVLASQGSVSHHINWWGLGEKYNDAPAAGWYILTFTIFLFALYYAVRKPLALFLETRSNDIRQAIEEAKLAKSKAEEKMQQYREKLSNLDIEIAALKEEFKKQGDLERARIKKEADAMAVQIINDSKDLIEADSKQAFLKLRNEVVTETIDLAKKEIQKAMSSRLESQLKEEFVKDVNQVVH